MKLRQVVEAEWNTGRNPIIVVLMAFLIVVAARSTGFGQVPTELVLFETHNTGLSSGDLALSPDEEFLYMAARSSGTVIAFDRDPDTGRLTFLDRDESLSMTIAPRDLDISPDGKHLYVAGFGDGLAVFSRNQTTGILTFIEARFEAEADVEGLSGATSVVVSPDGAHVYVGATSFGISTWERDPDSGALTFLRSLRLGGAQIPFADIQAEHMVMDVNGLDLYIVAFNCEPGSFPSHFRRDPETGHLTFVELNTVDFSQFPDRVFSCFPHGTVRPPDALGGAAGLALSPDMRHLCLAYGNDRAVLVFQRNLATGRLSFVQDLFDGFDGVSLRPFALAVSPDGTRVYTGNAVFLRDLETGRLQQEQVLSNDFTVLGPALVVASNSEHVYSVGRDVVQVFVRRPINRISSSRNVGFIEEGMRLELTAPTGVSNQWKLDGVDLVEDPPRLTGTTSQTLVFAPVLESDAGTYTVLYEDGMTKAIIETEPFTLDVLPPNSVPAAGMLALGLLTGALATIAATRLRKKE